MPVEQIVIEVASDSKQLDSLLNKLVKAGQLSKQQADQFRGDSQKFEDAAKKRAKLLDDEIKDLTELKLRKQQAFSTREIEEYNRRIKESESRIKSLGGEVKKQKETFSAFDRTLRNIGGTIAAAFTVERIIQFSIESVKLAARAEGVERAFSKLNDPNLLKNLRAATRGTVTDLELMRSAIRANNFQVPLEQLATFFEFATKRSIETGESVDYLVSSIVDGIGRKSTLVLDNLGISASELQAEIKRTGDFGQAAANIISRGLTDTGDVADTTAIKIQRINTALENIKKDFGDAIINALPEASGVAAIGNIQKAIDGFNRAIEQGSVSEAEEIRIRQLINAYEDEKKALEAKTGSSNTQNKLRKENAGRILAEKDAIQELLGAYKEFTVDQKLQENIANLSVRIQEATKAIGGNITQADLAAASFGKQSGAVKELIENYDKYLLLLEDGKSAVEAFAEVHKKEFNEFDRTVKALNEEEAAREALNDELRTSIYLLGLEAITAITKSSETKDKLQQNLDELDEDAQNRDKENAERFDNTQKDISDKKNKFAKEDRERLKELLEAEYEVAQARVDLARNIIGALSGLAKENAEAQQGLLAFEKLAAIASIIINLQKEIALNSALTIPGLRDAANIQSRLRAAAGIATVLGTAIPQFAKGVIDMQGPGTGTSDSIMARLSKGESVMTAAETSKYRKEFKAMREKRYEEYIFRNYQLPILKSYQNVNNEFNDRNIVHSLYKLRKGQDQLIAVVKQNKEHQLALR